MVGIGTVAQGESVGLQVLRSPVQIRSVPFFVSPSTINIMPNQTLQQQVASLWLGIRGQKAAQIEEQLRQSRQQVGIILGENYIETITHLSLLKLLAYRLVIFADGCSRSQ